MSKDNIVCCVRSFLLIYYNNIDDTENQIRPKKFKWKLDPISQISPLLNSKESLFTKKRKFRRKIFFRQIPLKENT